MILEQLPLKYVSVFIAQLPVVEIQTFEMSEVEGFEL
jgi:hypothetical protein